MRHYGAIGKQHRLMGSNLWVNCRCSLVQRWLIEAPLRPSLNDYRFDFECSTSSVCFKLINLECLSVSYRALSITLFLTDFVDRLHLTKSFSDCDNFLLLQSFLTTCLYYYCLKIKHLGYLLFLVTILFQYDGYRQGNYLFLF